MKRLLTLALCVLTPCAALPQARTGLQPGGLDSCELSMCACKPVAGQVDSCSRYWTFKKTGTSFVRVENDSPTACDESVGDNLSTLSTHYGRRPEIGVPTQEMVTALGALSTPLLGPLPDSQKLEAARPADESKPLDERISTALERVLALADDARMFSSVITTTASWEAAMSAARRLSKKADGIATSLSLARPWPSLREYAPAVWGIKVCERVDQDSVARIGKLVKEEGTDAWSFAFYGDWTTVLRPFEESKPPNKASEAKKVAFESIATPFFAEPVEKVKERSNKTLFTLTEVRAFRATAETVEAKLAPYVADRQSRSNARRAQLLASYEREGELVASIRAAVDSLQEALTSMRDSIRSTQAKRDGLANAIASLEGAIGKAIDTLRMLVSERDKLRAARDKLRTEVNDRRGDVSAAQQRYDAIVLECNGLPYGTCRNENAKRDYDRKRYEASVAIASARRAYTATSDRLMQVTDHVLAAEEGIQTHTFGMQVQKRDMSGMLKERDVFDVRLASLEDELKSGEARVLPLVNSMADLDRAMSSLEALRPR